MDDGDLPLCHIRHSNDGVVWEDWYKPDDNAEMADRAFHQIRMLQPDGEWWEGPVWAKGQ